MSENNLLTKRNIPPAPLQRGMKPSFLVKLFPKIKILISFVFLFFQTLSLNAQSNSNLQEKLDQAIALQNEDQYEQSIQLLEKTLENYKNAQPDSLLGLAYHKLGAAYYNTYQEKKAIESFQKALSVRKAYYVSFHPDITKTTRVLGVTYIELGDYLTAERYLSEAHKQYQKLEYSSQLMLNSIDLSKLYNLNENIEKSKEFCLSALDYLLTTNNDKFNYLIPSSKVVLATLYYTQDSIITAIEQAEEALSILKSWNDKYDEDYHDMADAYNTLAISYQRQRDFSTAINYHQQSLAINQRYPDIRQERIAATYVNLGMLYKEMRESEKAGQYFTQAMTIDSTLQNALNLGGINSNFGELYLQEEQPERALAYFETALTYLLPDWSKQEGIFDFDFSKNIIGDQKILLDVLNGMAKTYRLRHQQQNDVADLQKALELYTISTALIDRARFEFQREGSKRFLLNTTQPILAEGVATAVQLYDLTQEMQYAERAFEFSERSKSLILLEAVNDNKAKELAGIPLALREQERFYNQKTTYFTQQLYTERQATEPDLTQLTQLNDSLLHYNTTLENLIEKIETDYPQYFQLKYTFQPISIKNIQEKILTEEKSLLEYFVTDSTIFAFHIAPQSVNIHQIKRDFPLNEWIEDLTAGITGNYSVTKKDSISNYDQLYVERATQLYQKLWSFIDQPTAANQQIIIVPDGVLGYIPFATLLTQSIDNQQIKNYSTYPFLIKNHQISYSYSATLLAEQLSPINTAATDNLLAFAPTFGQMSLTLAANDRSGLAPLIHNRREVKTITEIIDGQAFYGADASRNSFLENAPNYRYLHLSSHARMNDWKPEYSYVSFTQPLDDSLDKSKILYVDDLYNVSLNADMVVLSACETAAGKLSRGEGIISLARAFSYAGARSIITTLWRVNDQKSADLMIDFYENLADGNSKDAALRNAQLDFIEEGTAAHPYFWAGFVPLGNMEAIEMGGFFVDWYLYLAGGIILLLSGVWWLKKI
ncbi:MAG: CHAT domain-containing protein [Saprospiraceae bacterium]